MEDIINLATFLEFSLIEIDTEELPDIEILFADKPEEVLFDIISDLFTEFVYIIDCEIDKFIIISAHAEGVIYNSTEMPVDMICVDIHPENASIICCDNGFTFSKRSCIEGPFGEQDIELCPLEKQETMEIINRLKCPNAKLIHSTWTEYDSTIENHTAKTNWQFIKSNVLQMVENEINGKFTLIYVKNKENVYISMASLLKIGFNGELYCDSNGRCRKANGRGKDFNVIKNFRKTTTLYLYDVEWFKYGVLAMAFIKQILNSVDS
eukprot:462937_1